LPRRRAASHHASPSDVTIRQPARPPRPPRRPRLPVKSSLESGRRPSRVLPDGFHLHPIPWKALTKLGVERVYVGSTEVNAGCRCPATPRRRWSGRPESNRRRPSWEAGSGVRRRDAS
jgi:hypothetical protein